MFERTSFKWSKYQARVHSSPNWSWAVFMIKKEAQTYTYNVFIYSWQKCVVLENMHDTMIDSSCYYYTFSDSPTMTCFLLDNSRWMQCIVSASSSVFPSPNPDEMSSSLFISLLPVQFPEITATTLTLGGRRQRGGGGWVSCWHDAPDCGTLCCCCCCCITFINWQIHFKCRVIPAWCLPLSRSPAQVPHPSLVYSSVRTQTRTLGSFLRSRLTVSELPAHRRRLPCSVRSTHRSPTQTRHQTPSRPAPLHPPFQTPLSLSFTGSALSYQEPFQPLPPCFYLPGERSLFFLS